MSTHLRQRGRRLASALLAIATLAALAACTSTGTAPAPTASQQALGNSQAVKFRVAVPDSGKGLTLGYISLDDSVPFIQSVTKSMQKEAAAAGATLKVCDAKSDATKALACAQQFKTQGVQGYLNFQADAAASPSICTAGPQGPVIAVDIEQQPCQNAFMGANNERAGEIVGKAIGTYFKSKFDCKFDTYVSLEQPDAGAVNTARMGGTRKGFESVCGAVPDSKFRAVTAFRIDGAQTAATNTLTALTGQHKIILVGINDDSVEGALAAAKTAGRQNDVYMGAQGGDQSAWCSIKTNSHWIADAAYFPEKYGQVGIPYLIDAVKGKKIPTELYIPHIALTSANIDSLYHPSC